MSPLLKWLRVIVDESETTWSRSGDQDLASSFSGVSVICVTAPPSAFITNRSLSPQVAQKPSAKTIRAPSGDQPERPACSESAVSFRTLRPSGRIVYTAGAPLRSLVNAMLLPSGDQSGAKSMAGWSVSLCSPVPFTLMTYMSRLPPRSERKAILVPSDDQVAL